MKKLLLLIAVLAALVGLAFVMKDSSDNQFKAAAARAKLLEGLDVNAVKKIRIKEGDKIATVALTGDVWTVAERSNYPAAFDKIKGVLVDSLLEQKSGTSRTMGKGA